MRWRVERAGSPGAWLTGWIAHIPAIGFGARFDSWGEAMRFVDEQVGSERSVLIEACS